jgi:hypothetical protein
MPPTSSSRPSAYVAGPAGVVAAVGNARTVERHIKAALGSTGFASMAADLVTRRTGVARALGLNTYGALVSAQSLGIGSTVRLLPEAWVSQPPAGAIVKQLVPPIQSHLVKIIEESIRATDARTLLVQQGVKVLGFPSYGRMPTFSRSFFIADSLTRVVDLIAPMQTLVKWVATIPWMVLEAEAALDAYAAGDPEPLFTFMATRLRLRRPTEDHAQALALALFTQDWKRDTDIRDPDAVRLVLRKLAAAGEDREANHQVAGGKIASLEHLQSRKVVLPHCATPGPEEIVVAELVSWIDRFNSRHVRNVVGRLNELERAVTRTWAEESYPSWPEAVLLHQQGPQFALRMQRKLRRHGKEIARRQGLLRNQEEK